METLMDEVNGNDLKLDLPQEKELTPSERDSMMLGEISPHHDYYDSKSSSETPPTYNQLNYNENLHRFFNSKPITIGIESALKIGAEPPGNIVCEPENALSPVQQCFEGSGGSGSAGNLSSESNVQMDSTTNTSNTGTRTSSGSFLPATLTEALLNIHNDAMEKCMLKKHKEVRSVGRGLDKMRKGPDKTIDIHGHGVKRSGSHSWEDEAQKNAKHLHLSEAHGNAMDIPMNIIGGSNVESYRVQGTSGAPVNQPPTSRNVTLWPPFSVSLTNIQSSHTTTTGQYSTPAGLYPALYYLPASQPNPTQGQRIAQATPGTPAATSYALQYMPSLMYPHPSLYGQHIVYPQLMYQPMPFQALPTSVSPTEQLQNRNMVLFF